MARGDDAPEPGGVEPVGEAAHSHGEGTTTPDQRPPAPASPTTREDDDSDLREELSLEDIYGGRADVAGYEEDVEGASDDAAG